MVVVVILMSIDPSHTFSLLIHAFYAMAGPLIIYIHNTNPSVCARIGSELGEYWYIDDVLWCVCVCTFR